MKRSLRILAAILVVAAIGFWVATGAHWGWNQSKVPKKTLDEITGIEQVTYEERFVAGFEFLGGATLAAGALLIASFFFRKKNTGGVEQTPV